MVELITAPFTGLEAGLALCKHGSKRFTITDTDGTKWELLAFDLDAPLPATYDQAQATKDWLAVLDRHTKDLAKKDER